ncbi:hypothetical protein [Halorubrum kocurii]|uniref:Uncharacterized protein n=1 Tax=Halorubrum kocurii JCM 14978 TaxID=1230456 RepID=M0NQ71_9EURY|nr:hypothetical protein [Halorubrum kocurii]EMA59773.1 hypothetical protein C468_14213 [Halorubrum kocurii JCM 14978]
MFEKLRMFEAIRINPTHLALATVAGTLAVGIAAETATSMAYVGGVFVVAGFLTGLVAPLGGVTGLVVYDLFQGTVGYSTLGTAAWILVFTGLVAWLTGPIATTSERLELRSIRRTVPADIGVLMIAGIHATAFAAWLVMLLGWRRFYTAALGFLPGVAVAIGVCTLVLVTVVVVRSLDRLPDRNYTFDLGSLNPAAPDRGRSAKRSTAVTAGAFVIGTGWLGGTFAFDIFVHDLGIFATADEFRAFVAEFLGTSSPIAAVGTSLLVSVYRYGELAVLLSAPLAMLALWGWCNYHKLILSSTIRSIKTISGGST